MNNKLIIIQEMLIGELKRLNEENIDKNEISRSNAMSSTAMTYIKTINLGLRIKEVANKNQMSVNSLKKELGIDEKEI